MESFTGYVITQQIGETMHFMDYRAHPRGTAETVVIKALKSGTPALAELARFKHEIDRIRNSSIDGIIGIIDIIENQDHIALVLEDFDGIPLSDIPKKSLSLERFLNLAVRLAEILGHLHRHHLSHRNIAPQSILLSRSEDIVRITDFGIAAEMTHQDREITKPAVVEKTLPYISPEQTGRMNCAVDYRTDLYSLGIVFYEMLAGHPPFKSGDAMELIHAHIAKTPPRPEMVNPVVPKAVSDIVMKLISKAAADRYQNGFGLAADLAQCRDQFRASGRIDSFELAGHDIPPGFLIPQILVGRDEQLQILHQAFGRAGLGSAEGLFVAGEAGIGKTSLIGEIHKPIVEKRGFFISGKYEQLRRIVPYSSIIQAFQRLVRQLLTENEENIRLWKDRILGALGPNGKIITDAIPEIELIIGRQPDIAELGPEETQNRFNLFFKNFVRVFADQSHPLVLFLDDLQWADSASLNLIQTVITDPELRFFLLIGAYRSAEVAAHHPLMLTLDAIRQNGVDVRTIVLDALNEEDVNQYVAGFLRYPPDMTHPLSAIVYHKTKGNPFFVNRFLKNLYEKEYLSLQPGIGWIWDLDKISPLQVTDNVVQFMAEKIGDLPEAPLKLIRICACMGNWFDMLKLAAIAGYPIDELLFTMDALIEEGLVNRTGDLYHFSHDRIQEAAYSALSSRERERIHYQIGILNFDTTPADQIFNRIFYIVDQMNQGRNLLSTPAERTRLADLNLTAGRKAKDSTAYTAAVAYLGCGIELLHENAWETDYDLTYALHTEQMECQFLNRNFTEAERLFEIIITRARTKIEKARAYKIMVVLYTNLHAPREAIALGLKALRLFGIRISIDVGKATVAWEFFKLYRRIRKMTRETIIALPVVRDQDILAASELMLNTGTPAYYVNPNLFALLAMTSLNRSLDYGLIPESSIAFLVMANVIQSTLGDYDLGNRMGETALQLNDKLGNQKVAGMALHIFAFFIQHWKKHIRYDHDIYTKVYELSMNTGDFIFAGHSITARVDSRIRSNWRLDDILTEMRKYRDFVNILKDHLIVSQYRQFTCWILAMMGQAPDRHNFSCEGFDMFEHIERQRKDGNIFALCFALYPRIMVHNLYGDDYEEALKLASELDRHIHVPMGTLIVADHYFHYSLILTALLQRGETKRKRKFTALIRRNQRKMIRWAESCSENFRHKYDLVEAEMAGIKGRIRKALSFYNAAVDGARKNEYLFEEALACERFALFYLRHGWRKEAGLFMERAHRCYRFWGAAAKAEDLEMRYAELIRTGSESAGLEIPSETSPPEAVSRLLDLSTVMQASQALSGEIVLDRLIFKILKTAVMNAGAERGFLILNTDETLTIEAMVEEAGGEDFRAVIQSMPLEACRDLSQAIVHYVARSSADILLGNAAEEGLFTDDPYVRQRNCKSILCLPVMNKGKLSGILYMENNLTDHAFPPERLELLRLLSSQAAISLENARLFEQATTDGLTRVFVHRYFQLLLDQELARSQRYHRSFSLLMIDIDNFKHFNDTYGHQLGDDVLREVARTVKKIARAEDVVARYGGEEFAVILPETDGEKAWTAAEKIRTAVENIEIIHGDGILHVTISLGLATCPDHARTKEELIEAADRALYVSKRTGKNRVSVYEGKG